MKNYILIATFTIFPYMFGLCQDTIYTGEFPNGLIFDKCEVYNTYINLWPIKNDEKRFVFRSKYINKIKTENKSRYDELDKSDFRIIENDKYVLIEKVSQEVYDDLKTLPIDPETGKVYYEEVVKIEGASKAQIYNGALSIISNGKIKAEIFSKDESNQTFIKYHCTSYGGRFARDYQIVVFNIIIQIKEGRYKIKADGFHRILEKEYDKTYYGYFGETTIKKKKFRIYELYKDYNMRAILGKSGDRGFWKITHDNFYNLIDDIKDHIIETSNDGW